MDRPDITEAEIEAVNEVLRTPVLSNGPQLEQFERQAAAYAGARYAVGVSSGTAGLHLCVLAAGVADGDMVITTPWSFVASANVMLYERAVPVFVDVDPDTLDLDPGLVAEAASDLVRGGAAAQRWLPPNPRGSAPLGHLKAILAVHSLGQPADMDPILETARTHGLAVIEDANEAIGAEYKGRQVGTLGDAGVFAFYPNKQMTIGEGGLIVTNRHDWDALFRSLRNQGHDDLDDSPNYDRDVFDAGVSHSRLGYNYRLPELSAALCLAQVGRQEELLAKRERVAGWYGERLSALAGVRAPCVGPHTTRVSWFVYYVARLAPEIDRGAVMAFLEARGIPSRPYFSPIHLQPYFRQRFGYREGDFPITEAAGRACLALPFSGTMAEQEVDYVCRQLAEALAAQGSC